MKRSLAVLLVLLAPAAGAQSSSDSKPVFSGSVPNGAWLRVRNHKGDVRVTETAGSTATVTARNRGTSAFDEETKFEVRRDGQNVTICAITRRTSRCDERGYSSYGGSDRDYSRTDFIVALPRGVKLDASTGNGEVDIRNAGAEVAAASGNGEVNVSGAAGRVRATSGNGDVTVDRADGDVQASSGNGDIRVTTARGPVSASTGNGGIDVSMSTLSSGDDDMDFNTGNGTITVAFPSNLSARVEANGSVRDFETDFPIQMGRGFSTNHVRGTIGDGSRRIRFSTGNGHIRLKKI